MATNQTPYFGLNQWEADDPVLRQDFNADNQKLDAALSALGNCQILSGSYIGTGTAGADGPCRLEFGFKPLVLFMNTSKDYTDNGHAVWIHPLESRSHVSNNNVDFEITWEETAVSWYVSATSTYVNAANQYNEEGEKYTFLALGYIP